MEEYKAKIQLVVDFLKKRKAYRTVESSRLNLELVCKDIYVLNEHISGKAELQPKCLQKKIDSMIAENTLAFDLEITKNLQIRRGRVVGTDLFKEALI